MKRLGAILVSLTLSVCLKAQTPVTLGTSGNFTVLAGSTVTNTGNTVVVGNVGVFPGTAVTGFPPGIVTGGVQHAGDAVADRYQLHPPFGLHPRCVGRCNRDEQHALVQHAVVPEVMCQRERDARGCRGKDRGCPRQP